ncbi:hypothetical protein Cni_G10683 [Canna indica]|uniref:Uncharacterized protein n=1 Tax=Canna indica TaxID=4628 RepID=A0AAQ3Q8T0_9LILI|nr:hypothetical protein Cni_G10683 [Canna indica]
MPGKRFEANATSRHREKQKPLTDLLETGRSSERREDPNQQALEMDFCSKNEGAINVQTREDRPIVSGGFKIRAGRKGAYGRRVSGGLSWRNRTAEVAPRADVDGVEATLAPKSSSAMSIASLTKAVGAHLAHVTGSGERAPPAGANKRAAQGSYSGPRGDSEALRSPDAQKERGSLRHANMSFVQQRQLLLIIF